MLAVPNARRSDHQLARTAGPDHFERTGERKPWFRISRIRRVGTTRCRVLAPSCRAKDRLSVGRWWHVICSMNLASAPRCEAPLL